MKPAPRTPLVRVAIALLLAGTPTGSEANPGSRHVGATQSASSLAPDELRRAAAAAGMTPEQLRVQLRDRADPLAMPGTDWPATVTAPPTVTEPPILPDSLQPNPRPRADLREPFGFELFRWAPATFEPVAYGPVDADYPLGPGDELVLTLWGDDQLSQTLMVGREGFITLPDAGQVQVAGLTLDAAKARVRVALAHLYSGLRGGRGSTQLALTLGRLRTIQVFLLGEVTRPGNYAISAMSRVLNALYAAGGPTRNGSLRDVRILRGGQVVAHTDLYDVILGGASAPMTRIENGDVVFVPPAARRVMVAGPVRRPGLFELKEGEQLRALMTLAGGPLAESDLARAQIDRCVPAAMRDSLRGQGRVAIDVPIGQLLADAIPDVPVMDADTLTLFAVGTRRGNTVVVSGKGVVRPGTYEYRAGMTVRDLLEAAGGPTPDAFLWRAQIVRTAPDSARSSLRFDLGRALAGDATENLALQALDEMVVMTRWSFEERKQVSIHGLVRRPGTYELLEGMTLADLLLRAGGLTDEAFDVRAELARVSNSRSVTDTSLVPIARDFARSGEAATLLLQPQDAVFIRRDPNFREQEFVLVEGEVRFPGLYALTRRDERVRDLVERAGGLTDYAYARGSTFRRASAQPNQASARLAIDLPLAMKQPRHAMNLVLQPGDTLSVPRYTPTVTIEGAVLTPLTVLWQPGAGIGWYVTQASGFRQDADRRATVVVSPAGRVRRGGQPEPGSRVIVPARTVSEGKDHLKDFSTLMSILASAATTIYLVQQSGR